MDEKAQALLWQVMKNKQYLQWEQVTGAVCRQKGCKKNRHARRSKGASKSSKQFEKSTL